MISTGMTGTAPHGTSPKNARRMRGNKVHGPAPPPPRTARAAPRQDRRSRPCHVGRVDRVPRGLQREISFDRSAEVESAPMKQRPTAIRTLGRANVSRDPRLQLGLDAAEVVLE